MSNAWHLGRQSVLVGPRLPGRALAKAFAPEQEKYTVEAPIGRGGMGEILLVSDHDLKRQVAMKVLLPEAAGDEESRLHFVAEAQATSQLEHPGIPPVHDIGVMPDGRIYFTMKLVRGRTLREILRDLIVKRAEVQREWTLHRLVSVVERLCETLHFAHERGVVHRDLKPENVMLGDYGEVHVMDWGLAQVGSAAPAAPEGEALAQEAEPVRTARTEAALHSQRGSIKGTLPYMAPEQLTGTASPRTDVYALGLLLYEVLTLHPAFDPHASGLVEQVAAGILPAVETRNPRRPVPASLAAACRKATAKEPSGRFPGAQELASVLRAWLDGTSERERRHREAEELTAKGGAAAAGYGKAKVARTEAEREAERLALEFKPWQKVVEKRPWMEAKARAQAAKTAEALAFAEALKLLEAARMQEPEHAGAGGALAGLWRVRMEEAERRGEADDAAYARTMIRLAIGF